MLSGFKAGVANWKTPDESRDELEDDEHHKSHGEQRDDEPDESRGELGEAQVEEDLVETPPAAVSVHDDVVVQRRQHSAASERVTCA